MAASGSNSTQLSPAAPLPLLIYNALIKAGASAVQAVGIMGNMIAESSLDPEEINPGGPQSGVGLVQWQTTDYPNVPMPTGNPAADAQNQVNFLAQTGGLSAASGTTISETAGNFAANYERCSGCQAGGAQYAQRIANAQQVAGWAASGNWPASSGQASASAQLTSAQAQEQSDQLKQEASNCVWSVGFNWGSGAAGMALSGLFAGLPGIIYDKFAGGGSNNIFAGSVCVLSKPELRAMAGWGLIIGGGMALAGSLALLMSVAGVAAPALMMRAASPIASAARTVGARAPAAAAAAAV